MNIFKRIYPTKSFLAQSIKKESGVSIEFLNGPTFFIRLTTDICQNILPLSMVKRYDNGIEVEYETFENFVSAIWSAQRKLKIVSEVCVLSSIGNTKKGQPVGSTLVKADVEWMEALASRFMDEAQRKSDIRKAKKQLTKKQTEDHTLGLTSVIYPMEAKMILEDDKELTQMAQSFGNIVAAVRAAEGYGVYGNEAREVMDALNEMQDSAAAIIARINDCPTIQQNIENLKK